MIKNFYNLIIGIILFIFLVFIVINYNDSKLIVIDNINILGMGKQLIKECYLEYKK